jgi:hypothetical protein
VTRRFNRFVSVEQASKALNLHAEQILAMLKSGQLDGTVSGPDNVQLVSSTAVELAKQRLENFRRLDGDVQQ